MLYWKSTVNCSISNYSLNHIDAEVVDNIKGKWWLTRYYGFPENGRRRDAWSFLRQLVTTSSLPWCIFGDFNDILSPNEKKGRNDRANWLINGFRNVVLDAGLVDVHMEGYCDTWFKSLGTSRDVEERLDRALATENWQQQYPYVVLKNLPAPSSDHYPIMLLCESGPRRNRKCSRFKFENTWLADPDFNNYVTDRWVTYGTCPIVDKLDFCAEDLSNWSKNNFNHLKRDIDECRKLLDRM